MDKIKYTKVRKQMVLIIDTEAKYVDLISLEK